MNNYQKLAVLSFIAGIVLIAISVLTKEGGFGIFIIFPFFYGIGIFAFLGGLCLMVAFFLFYFGLFQKFEIDIEEEKIEKETKTNYGGVVLIGPIPIIFGKDVRLTIILVVLAIVMMVVVFFLFYWR